MSGLFLSFAAYSLIENELNRCFPKEKKNIINNFLSSFHICSLFMFSFLYEISLYNIMWLEYIKYNTCGYFFYDVLTIIKNRQFSKSNIIMIYHHVIASVYFLNTTNGSYWYLLLWYGEMSNIPSQFVYHYLQREKQGINHTVKLIILKSVQLYVYGFLRVIIISYYMFYEFQHVYYSEPNNGDIYYYLTIPVYIMGLLWSGVLYKKSRQP